jgi:hypothetical protein
MREKFIGLTLGAMLFALCNSAQGQQTGKIFRIGILDPSTAIPPNVLARADRVIK